MMKLKTIQKDARIKLEFLNNSDKKIKTFMVSESLKQFTFALGIDKAAVDYLHRIQSLEAVQQ